MPGPTPWYFQAMQYTQWFVTILYPIFLVLILFLAWRDFRRLVNHFAPPPVAEEEEELEELEMETEAEK